MSLVKVLQEVRQNGATQRGSLPPQASTLPGQVQETILMLQWFVNEAQQLSPDARLEAFRCPPPPPPLLIPCIQPCPGLEARAKRPPAVCQYHGVYDAGKPKKQCLL